MERFVLLKLFKFYLEKTLKQPLLEKFQVKYFLFEKLSTKLGILSWNLFFIGRHLNLYLPPAVGLIPFLVLLTSGSKIRSYWVDVPHRDRSYLPFDWSRSTVSMNFFLSWFITTRRVSNPIDASCTEYSLTSKGEVSLYGSPGLVVMGGDSGSKGREFESRYRISTGWTFFHIPICCKICNVCLRRRN